MNVNTVIYAPLEIIDKHQRPPMIPSEEKVDYSEIIHLPPKKNSRPPAYDDVINQPNSTMVLHGVDDTEQPSDPAWYSNNDDDLISAPTINDTSADIVLGLRDDSESEIEGIQETMRQGMCY